MQSFRPESSLKSDSNTGVSCEYWEIFKSTYFKGWLLLELSNKASRDGENYILHTIYLKKTNLKILKKEERYAAENCKEEHNTKIYKKILLYKKTPLLESPCGVFTTGVFF